MSATKDKFSAVLSYVSLLEHIRRTVNIAPCILHLGTGWKVIFELHSPVALRPRRSFRYLLDSRLIGLKAGLDDLEAFN